MPELLRLLGVLPFQELRLGQHVLFIVWQYPFQSLIYPPSAQA